MPSRTEKPGWLLIGEQPRKSRAENVIRIRSSGRDWQMDQAELKLPSRRQLGRKPTTLTTSSLRARLSGVNPRLFLLLLCSFISTPVSLWAQGYSRSATPIWARGTIHAPDRKKTIVVEPVEGLPTILVRAGSHTYSPRMAPLIDAEAAWSPDSKAFFLTYSDAGVVGRYHVLVVYVTDAGVHVIEPVPDGSRLFRPTCVGPELPNVGAIGWIGSGSDRLAIAIEVPPHSSCASMGTFEAYVIQLPNGEVVSKYGQIEAKHAFRKLIGNELRGAEDECIEYPQSCIPCGMKGGDCGR